MQVESSGTQTATLNTEHDLATPSSAKTRALIVDAAALAAGETLELYAYAKVLSGGTERLIQRLPVPGVLAEPHIQSPPFLMPQGGRFSLKQIGGTGRSYPWAVITLD